MFFFKLFVFGEVKFFVSLHALVVVPEFFEGRDCQHKDQWSYVRDQKTHFQKGHKLRECNQQEKHVEEELEFIIKQFGEESKQVVLGVVQLVSRIGTRSTPSRKVYLSLLSGSNETHKSFDLVPTAQVHFLALDILVI